MKTVSAGIFLQIDRNADKSFKAFTTRIHIQASKIGEKKKIGCNEGPLNTGKLRGSSHVISMARKK